MPVVIDASAALAWLFGEEEPNNWIEAQLQSNSLIAPSLWQLEVVYAILKKERQRHITPKQTDSFLSILDAIPIEIVPPPPRTLQHLANVARPHQLTAYDAVYLDLSVTRQAELLTLDNNLRGAARRLKIRRSASCRSATTAPFGGSPSRCWIMTPHTPTSSVSFAGFRHCWSSADWN